jgi:hypothetical protein
MSKFAKGKSWIEHRLADALVVDGAANTVNLVARKGTGVQGFRMTVTYIPHEGGTVVEAALPNAPSTVEVNRAARELGGDEARLRALYRDARTA